MRTHVRLRAFIAAAVWAAGPATLAAVLLGDGDFKPSSWVVEAFLSPLAFESAVNETATRPTGGNPGACREIDVTVGAAPLEGAVVVHLFACAVWNTAEHGPVFALDASVDFVSRNGAPAQIGFVVRQGGKFYGCIVDSQASTTNWTTFARRGLTSDDFEPLLPTDIGRPDFSATGGELRFGFASGQLGAMGGGATRFVHCVDNWSLAINPLPAAVAAADGDFAEGAWEWEAVLSTLGNASAINAVTTRPTGGNPGSYRVIDATVGTAPVEGAAAVQLAAGVVWNPATMGPVRRLGMTLDFLSLSDAPTRIGFVVAQHGKYYAHVPATQAFAGQWTTFSAEALAADDFPPLMPFEAGRPDFSAAGGELRFGFATGQVGVYGDGRTSFVHGVDNWGLEVNPQAQAAVPPQGEFDEAEWDLQEFVSPVAQASVVNGVATRPTGGNPGAYREIDFSLGAAFDEGVSAVELFVPRTWSLATDGPIYTIDAALDFVSRTGAPAAVLFVVELNGDIFVHEFALQASAGTWTTFMANGLTAEDFRPIIPFQTGLPDLRGADGSVRFGFATGQVGEYAAGHTEFLVGFDNWSVVVNRSPSVEVPCGGSGRFARGDANADGRIDIGDAITVLTHLFARGSCSCKDAADANDDERLDIADAIKILAHLFARAGPLPPPFGACGDDPEGGALGCENFEPCP